MKVKNKKLFGSLIVMVFVMMFFSNILSTSFTNNSPKTSKGTTPTDLINIDFSIYIKDNWSETITLYDWCSGNGTEIDPYIIEGIYVTNGHLSIETAEHFIIRNCVFYNYSAPYGHYTFAGIYIEKGEYGLIENCTIVNCSTGISLYDAKDSLKITNCRFIGSHDNNITGMGAAIRIQEAKGVNISYNDINNFYDGIIVRDAESIYIENNRIQTNFGWISDTGIYFYSVNDSSIINNDFYNCTFDGHEYDEPETSSNRLKISFPNNCFNITVYGNKFYVLDGDLIEDLDGIDTLKCIFIILGVVGSFIYIYTLIYLFKKYRKRGMIKNE